MSLKRKILDFLNYLDIGYVRYDTERNYYKLTDIIYKKLDNDFDFGFKIACENANILNETDFLGIYYKLHDINKGKAYVFREEYFRIYPRKRENLEMIINTAVCENEDLEDTSPDFTQMTMERIKDGSNGNSNSWKPRDLEEFDKILSTKINAECKRLSDEENMNLVYFKYLSSLYR